jgi:RHS repeat-associated protein
MVASRYAWDPEFDCITKETDASTGAINVRYTQEPKPYGGLISQRRGSATRYYHYDNVGTTRALTNQAGSPTDRTTYTAFGELIDSTGATINPFGYVGEIGYQQSGVLSSLYVRRRNYHAAAARWLSYDKYRVLIDVNLFRYALNRPTAGFDPSGRACKLKRDEMPPKSIDSPPIDNPYYSAPAMIWEAIAGPYDLRGDVKPVTGALCNNCKMDIEVDGAARRYYRKVGDLFFTWDGVGSDTHIPENEPRNFFSVLVVKVCKTSYLCCSGSGFNSEELYEHTFYTDGLGTYIQYAQVLGIKRAMQSFRYDDPCNFGRELISHVRGTAEPGDGVVAPYPEF